MLLQILDTWSLRLHVESNKTPKFLGGSLLGVMRESPMFMPICWFWLELLWVVITISSVLSSFSFKRLLVIHIFMPLIQASRQDIAVSFDTDTPGRKEIYNWVSYGEVIGREFKSTSRTKQCIVYILGMYIMSNILNPLRWRHNGHDSVSNQQPHHCLLNCLFRRRSKKTSKPRVTGLYVGNSPGTGEFPAQMASNAENVSIWWRHHDICFPTV